MTTPYKKCFGSEKVFLANGFLNVPLCNMIHLTVCYRNYGRLFETVMCIADLHTLVTFVIKRYKKFYIFPNDKRILSL